MTDGMQYHRPQPHHFHSHPRIDEYGPGCFYFNGYKAFRQCRQRRRISICSPSWSLQRAFFLSKQSSPFLRAKLFQMLAGVLLLQTSSHLLKPLFILFGFRKCSTNQIFIKGGAEYLSPTSG